MAPFVDYMAILEDKNFGGDPEGTESVGNHENGFACDEFFQGLLNLALALGV